MVIVTQMIYDSMKKCLLNTFCKWLILRVNVKIKLRKSVKT